MEILIIYIVSAVIVGPTFAWGQMTDYKSFTVGDLLLVIALALTPILNTILMIAVVFFAIIESRIIRRITDIQLYRGGKS